MKLLVEELALSIPEVSGVDARSIAKSVIERIERHMPADSIASLGAMQLRVTIPGDASEDDLADTIARAILRGMGR